MNTVGKFEIRGENIETREAVGVSEIKRFSVTSSSDSALLFKEVPMMTS